MQFVVALDTSKRRDITEYIGDGENLDVLVYQNDGDETPIEADNARILTPSWCWYGGQGFPVGLDFSIGSPTRRTPYQLVAEIGGVVKTLAVGQFNILGIQYPYGGVQTPVTPSGDVIYFGGGAGDNFSFILGGGSASVGFPEVVGGGDAS